MTGRGGDQRRRSLTVAIAFALCTTANATLTSLLPETLTVLEDTLRSTAERLPFINEDVAVGFRIVADQLQLEVERLNSSLLNAGARSFLNSRSSNFLLDADEVKSQVKSLRDFSKSYVPRALDVVRKKSAPDSYSMLVMPLAQEGRWRIDFPEVRIDVNRLVEPDLDERFWENVSDKCVRELTTARDRMTCSLSPGCLETMTRRNATGYWLTHEAFYMFIASTTPCYDKILSYLRTQGWRDMQNFLRGTCTNVLRDAEYIASLGFPPRHHDLFVEQIAFCGMAGVKEMYRPEWMRKIFSWKRPHSCFGLNELPSTGNLRRRKRTISLSNDMCQLHMTILGAINTAVALRYMLH